MQGDIKIELLNNSGQNISFYYTYSTNNFNDVGSATQVILTDWHQQDPKSGNLHLWLNTSSTVLCQISFSKYLTCSTNYSGWPNLFNWNVGCKILKTE